MDLLGIDEKKEHSSSLMNASTTAISDVQAENKNPFEVFYNPMQEARLKKMFKRPSLKVSAQNLLNIWHTSQWGNYAKGSEIHAKLLDFNRTYMQLLNLLIDAFSGRHESLVEAVGIMHDLKYKAVALVSMPPGEGLTTVGPSFEYISPRTLLANIEMPLDRKRKYA